MAVSKRIRTDLALETTERFKEENKEIPRTKVIYFNVFIFYSFYL